MIDTFTTWLRLPQVWMIAAALAGLIGLALGNGWLTASALLSVLMALAPCLLMCALGLCLRYGSSSSCKDHASAIGERRAKAVTREP